MTDVTEFRHIPAVARTRTAPVALPAPEPFGAPVLISDCASPLAGQTVLALLWRRLDGSDAKAPDPEDRAR